MLVSWKLRWLTNSAENCVEHKQSVNQFRLKGTNILTIQEVKVLLFQWLAFNSFHSKATVKNSTVTHTVYTYFKQEHGKIFIFAKYKTLYPRKHIPRIYLNILNFTIFLQ